MDNYRIEYSKKNIPDFTKSNNLSKEPCDKAEEERILKGFEECLKKANKDLLINGGNKNSNKLKEKPHNVSISNKDRAFLKLLGKPKYICKTITGENLPKVLTFDNKGEYSDSFYPFKQGVKFTNLKVNKLYECIWFRNNLTLKLVMEAIDPEKLKNI